MKQLSLFILFILFMACDKDTDMSGPNCGQDIEINADRVNDVSDNFALLSAIVEGKCLTVTIAATGCGSDARRSIKPLRFRAWPTLRGPMPVKDPVACPETA